MSSTLLLALALLHPAQDAPRLVTYETVAVSVDKAVEGLSKASGVVLKTAPAIANETVVLVVKDAPLEDVKSRLAKVVSGRWTKEADGSETLGIDAAARGAEAREDVRKRSDMISKGLKNLQSVLLPGNKDTQAPPDIRTGDFFGVSGSGAGKTLIAQLSFALRVSDLAAIPPDGRVVYSTTPNAMQRPLGVAGMAKMMSDYAAGHNKEVETALGMKGNMDPEQAQKLKEMQKTFGVVIPEPKKFDAPPSKVLLIVERGSRFGFMGESIDLKMIAFDGAGNVLAEENDSIDPDGGQMMERMATVEAAATGQSKPEQEQPPHDAKLDKQIELSKLSQELASLTNIRSMGASRVAPSPELMERILHPEVYDPLSYEVSEDLVALAKVEGQNLVACLSDGPADIGSMVSAGQSKTLFSFKTELTNSDELSYEVKDGWAVIQPKNPVQARAMKVDRRALGRLLLSAQKTILPTLDALADYASVNPPIMETPVVMPSIMLVAPNAATMGMRGVQDWPMLRLYGSMGQGPRTILRQGQGVPFAGVGSKGLALIKAMVYGAGAQFQVGPDKSQEALGFFGMASSMMSMPIASFKQEPTELLPNGLPAQGTLTLTLTPGHFVMSDLKSGMAALFGAIGPEEYAMLKYFNEEPSMAAVSSMMPKLDKFKVGDRDILDFRLLLASDVTQKHTLLDHRISKDAAIVGADALPKDFLATVDKHLKMFKEGLSPLMFGSEMFGGGRPPE